MLFHITQVHTPETCPRDEGGSNSLFNPNVPGLKLLGRYGANGQHILFYYAYAPFTTLPLSIHLGIAANAIAAFTLLLRAPRLLLA